MHKLPLILIMCWDHLNILFWQRQSITPYAVHILLHIIDLLLLLKLQQLLLAAWRWSPCPPSSPSCPPPTTCWAWFLHQWWQDCWWLMITKNTMVKRWPLAMVNETKMTNVVKDHYEKEENNNNNREDNNDKMDNNDKEVTSSSFFRSWSSLGGLLVRSFIL